MPKVQTASETDAEQVIASLTLAFATDPVIRAFYPDPFRHLAHFPEMMRINIGGAIPCQTAHYVEGFSAAAIWFPPAAGAEDGEAAKERGRRVAQLVEETAHKEGNDDLFVAMSEMDALHPKEPHWYLFAIGVDPYHQSEGLGSLLLEHALPRSDADGVMAYLESSNPRNVPFYQRHGFEIMEVVQRGSSPTFTLMVRDPS